MVITARAATTDDVPALVRLINRAYQVELFFVTGKRTSTEEIHERLSRPGGRFLVIDDDRLQRTDDERIGGPELAGAVYVQAKGDRGYLAMLSVHPVRQKTGLSRILIDAAEQYCREASCRFLDLDIVNLRTELTGFYARLGFVPFDTAPFNDPHRLTRPAHLVLMTKPLVDIWA
jgi:GNAT superfamily N-acetyltransferase